MDHRCTVSTIDKQTELPRMPSESSFQPECSNTKHSTVLPDVHIPQDAKDGLASLLDGGFNSTISKSPMDVRRSNLFQMDIPITGPQVACQLYPIPLKYQKFVN